MAEEIRLSPPWYSYANKIKYTYGASPLVQCNDLFQIANEYALVINTFDNEVAYALRQILPEVYSMGNININIIIFNKDGNKPDIAVVDYTVDELRKLFSEALKENPLFNEIYVPYTEEVSSMVGNIVIIIDKAVVQFYNDDISDLCRNYNEVASKVFKEISNLNFGENLLVGFTTESETCHKMEK